MAPAVVLVRQILVVAADKVDSAVDMAEVTASRFSSPQLPA